MHRYFFDVHDGIDIYDDMGLEFDSFGEAKLEAVRFFGSLMQSQPEKMAQPGEEWTISVRDESGLILYYLMFILTESPAVKRFGSI